MFRKARRQSSADLRVEACPRCGSLNIQLSSTLDVWLMPKQYVCRDCGYKGPIVLELEKEKKEKGN
jgi:predicted RNA-binding Zn-ribbon protein involved in translation (DUF1610 family)